MAIVPGHVDVQTVDELRANVLGVTVEGVVQGLTAAPEKTSEVAGGDLAIPQLAYFPSWGFPPCRITREVVAPVDLIG